MNVKRKRLKSVFAVGLALSMLLTGCGGESKEEEKSAKEILTEAVEKFGTYKSYEEQSDSSGSTVTASTSEGKLYNQKMLSNLNIKTVVDGDIIYSFTKGETDQKIPFAYLRRVSSTTHESVNMTFKDEGNVSFSSYKTSEIKEDEQNLLQQDVDLYLKGEFASYFKLKKEKDQDNTIITIYCDDLKGYQESYIKKKKEENSDYDPLDYARTGIKTSKYEIKNIEEVFTINKEGNLIKHESKNKTDYGDGYVTDATYTSTYSNFDEAGFDLDTAKKIIDGFASGEFQDGAVVTWK